MLTHTAFQSDADKGGPGPSAGLICGRRGAVQHVGLELLP
jgi:hypothetical protein